MHISGLSKYEHKIGTHAKPSFSRETMKSAAHNAGNTYSAIQNILRDWVSLLVLETRHGIELL